MTTFSFHVRPRAGRCFALSSLALACLACHAQPTASSVELATTQRLGEVTITGNPLGAASPIVPASSLSGTPLLLRSQPTLGETLQGEPGVSSSYFGPNASRPVIRGLEGDRIRILSNGGGSFDLSGLSPDHAVSIDPLSAERIEVLRGPGALLYGGSAVGGAVNVIDNRIARQPAFGREGGVLGKADVSWTTGKQERAAGVLLESGNERYQLHVDAFDRKSGDVPAPVALACEKDGVTVTRRRLCNSANQADGGAVGLSWFGAHSYVGVSASTYRSQYGVVAEDDVTIGMRSNRYALEGEVRSLPGLVRSLRWSVSHNDYAHSESSPGHEPTRFANRGTELRLEARHAPLGAWEGVFGVQLDAARFSAQGDEVFAPPSKTSQAAAFVYEERAMSWGKLSAGGRIESVRVVSLGDGAGGHFAAARRDFTPMSLSLGALRTLGGGWQLNSNLSYTERAPRDYELFADGPHVATAAYEIGNRTLGKEKSVQADLGAQWRVGPNRLRANVYMHRFSNFIALVPTGSQSLDGKDEFRYQQAPAVFRGLELSGNRRLIAGPASLDLGLRADMVRAENRDTGEPLPRIAPWRLGSTLTWTQAAWSASLGADHVGAQQRVPSTSAGARPGTTSAYTLWNAAATYRQRAGSSQLLWYARLDNLGNQLAYSATSILTTTVPGRVPLPGRMLKVGLQVAF